jgi:hypothetical protein
MGSLRFVSAVPITTLLVGLLAGRKWQEFLWVHDLYASEY